MKAHNFGLSYLIKETEIKNPYAAESQENKSNILDIQDKNTFSFAN